MKAVPESILSADHRNNLNRRQALVSTAAVGALALPPGAAVAAVDDPSVAAIAAGYREWRELVVQCDALEPLEEEAMERASASLPEPEPKPEPEPDVAKLWHGLSGLIDDARDPDSYVSIPQDLLGIAMEAGSLGEIDEYLAKASYYGIHDGWVSEDLLPVLLADLRAMVEGSA